MTRIVNSFSIIAAILTVLLCAGAAQALEFRTWVSGLGNDTGQCTRAAPCQTFSVAYSKTAVGGEIDVLDTGEYGNLVIQHAITIASDGAGTGGILNPGGAGIVIEAGATDAVILRGLEINGLGTGIGGVVFDTGGSLLVDHCKMYGFQGNFGQVTAGITFQPNGASKLWVTDSVISNNGISTTGNVLIRPQAGGSVAAQFERVQIVGAIGNGVRVDGTTGGAGATELELHDVVVDGSSESGIVGVSASGGAAVTIIADNVTASNNVGYGVRSYGGTSIVYLSRSTVTGNNIGVGVSSGGVLISYSDNRIRGNLNSDGSPTSTVPLN